MNRTPSPLPNRHLPLFLRALWGLEVTVQVLPPLEPPSSTRSRYQQGRLQLPSFAPHDLPATSEDSLLAAAAHGAAHLRFGPDRLELKRLTALDVAVISLLEDARVERLACAEYPGLVALWSPFHVAREGGARSSQSLLARLARALHDPSYRDTDAWVNKGRELFERTPFQSASQAQMRELGNLLASDLGQMRVQFNAKEYVVEPAYRDDNSGLWRFEQSPSEHAEDGADHEAARSVEHSSAGAPPRPAPAPAEAEAVRLQAEAAREAARQPSADAHAALTRYPEWDYVIARARPAFCTVRDAGGAPGDPASLATLEAQQAPARRRLARAAARLSQRRPSQRRRLLDGDRLDWPRALDALVALASKVQPDLRVYRRVQFQRDPPAVLLLLDLSESLNAKAESSSSSLLELARNASHLFLDSLSGVVHDVAVLGFSSNGRHEVNAFDFKHFHEPFDASVRGRLAGMRAHSSTRLGAALRHAARALGSRPTARKVLLLVSDGEPSDVDVHDPEYLLADARQAVIEARRKGVLSYCIGLDPNAEPSVRRIFGAGQYVLLERAEQLPERLSQLYERFAQ